jgi:CO/xanthine dehydrogenase Mo-binding subunit
MIVGSNRIRIDAIDKVLGKPVFAGDRKIDGALHVVVFRSP